MDPDFLVGLILLLPIAGAVFCGIGGLFVPALRSREGLIGTIATSVVFVPFLAALFLFLNFEDEAIIAHFFTWMSVGDFSVAFEYRIDQLSLLMTLVVTGVGGLIHLYSVGYMKGDTGFWRFFAYLNLFIFAMLNLVLANNLVVLFLGWEGVGLCSYLLIGFWYTDLKNSAAATKAFIMNRIGDFAFLLAMFLLYRELGSLDFDVLLTQGPLLGEGVLYLSVFLLFMGATGKSAQIPLFTWLPDAMAGPTPVSALIHAATMVTSGLYLLARLSPLVLAAEGIMAFIAIIGALTAIMAATIAITQNDIKKVLAYSTISQLGFMFMASGVGAFAVAIFHVMTHAFFKGCLFLGSGSVIRAMHDVKHQLDQDGEAEGFDPQDMRTMGGLKKYMPSTRITFLLSTLAIAGIPLFSGFFSKDEILFRAFEATTAYNYAWFAWIVGLITAFLTAVYMMRAYVLTFEGEERWPSSNRITPHESPWTMTTPLWILGILSVVGGFVGLPGVIAHGDWNRIRYFLGEATGGPVAEPHMEGHVGLGTEWALMALGSFIAISGVFLAWRWYTRHGLDFDESLSRRFGRLYRIWENKYFVDEAYDRVFVRPIIGGAEKGLAPFDQYVIDGLVNFIAFFTRGSGFVLRYIQTGVVQTYALAIVFGTVLVMALMLFG